VKPADRDAQPLDVQPERALLGGLLSEPGHLLAYRGRLESSDFYLPHHGRLYALLCHMLDKGDGIDIVTVTERVTYLGADAFGGAAYVAQLPEHCPSTTNLRSYVDILLEHARVRRLRSMAHTLTEASEGRGPSGDLPVVEIAATWGLQLSELAVEHGEKTYQSSFGASLDMAEQQRLDRESGASPPPVDIRFPDLQKIVTFSPGDLVVIGGETSMGKSALAQAFACGIVRDPTAVVLYHTLEMPRPRLAVRLAACVTRIPTRAIRENAMLPVQEEALERFRRAIANPNAWRLEINDQPGVTIDQVVASARAQRARGGLRALFVDHLHLMRHARRESRTVSIGETTARFKELAIELECPVFLLSQCNRAAGRRESPRMSDRDAQGPWWEGVALPELGDLRDSGAIEQDADTVLFPIHAGKCGVEGMASAGAVIVAKQREGELGIVGCLWDGPCTAYRPYGESR
jgi:replicative DNA helicase